MPKYNIMFSVDYAVDSLVDAEIFLSRMEEQVPNTAMIRTRLIASDHTGLASSNERNKNQLTLDVLFKSKEPDAKD